TKASSLRDGEDEYDIKVALGPRFKNDLQSILAMRIPGRIPTSPNTFPVPLSAVASYELAGGSGSIRHIDQDLVVTVTGDVAGGFNENAVRAEVVKYIETADMPEGYRLRLGGANDEQKKTQEFLGNAFLICLFLIALVLVSQFNSYSKPLIILFSVVLSMVGVLWGLVITGTSFGVVMTGLGVISLAGVVVNNAIVLLDYVEKLRARGLSVFDALVEAGVVRFRPVMLTAITTILGLAPMGLGITIDFAGARVLFGGPSAEWWGPMANAVIFGLAFATILTLVVVPALYMIIEDVAGVWDRAKARVFGKPDELQQPASAGADAE
ncbi:MAG: AcrB/AcrD/AcrF family protein, partial [Deltaproteobacteria bacterium]